MIRKAYEVDPMLCPKCGGTMKVVAFLKDFSVADRIIQPPQADLCRGEAPAAGDRLSRVADGRESRGRIFIVSPSRIGGKVRQISGLSATADGFRATLPHTQTVIDMSRAPGLYSLMMVGWEYRGDTMSPGRHSRKADPYRDRSWASRSGRIHKHRSTRNRRPQGDNSYNEKT
jgi:hypothetical protein